MSKLFRHNNPVKLFHIYAHSLGADLELKIAHIGKWFGFLEEKYLEYKKVSILKMWKSTPHGV